MTPTELERAKRNLRFARTMAALAAATFLIATYNAAVTQNPRVSLLTLLSSIICVAVYIKRKRI